MWIIDCLDRNIWIIILANVLFFMVVQTLFFVFVASNQYQQVLESKLEMIKTFISKNPEIRESVNETKKKKLAELKDISRKQLEKRTKENFDLTLKYCGIPIIVISVIMLVLV